MSASLGIRAEPKLFRVVQVVVLVPRFRQRAAAVVLREGVLHSRWRTFGRTSSLGLPACVTYSESSEDETNCSGHNTSKDLNPSDGRGRCEDSDPLKDKPDP